MGLMVVVGSHFNERLENQKIKCTMTSWTLAHIQRLTGIVVQGPSRYLDWGFGVYLVILTRRLLRNNTWLDIYRTCRQVFSTVGCNDVILQMPESEICLLQKSFALKPQIPIA